MVVRAFTGCAVVGASRCQGGLMEGVHLLGGVRTQGEVDGGGILTWDQPEIWTGALGLGHPHAAHVSEHHEDGIPQRFQGLFVEGSRGRRIMDSKRCVINHARQSKA